ECVDSTACSVSCEFFAFSSYLPLRCTAPTLGTSPKLGVEQMSVVLVNRLERNSRLVVRCRCVTTPTQTQLTGTRCQLCQPPRSLNRLWRCNRCRRYRWSTWASHVRQALCPHPV